MFIYRINASYFISLLSIVYNIILSGTANLCLKFAVIRPLHNMCKLFTNNNNNMHLVFFFIGLLEIC